MILSCKKQTVYQTQKTLWYVLYYKTTIFYNTLMKKYLI